MLQALLLSFTRYDLMSPPELVGFANYVALLSDENFLHSLGITLIYVFGTVIPVWFFSFGVALLLTKARVFAGGWRTLLFIPTILPLLSVTLVWKLLFNLRGVSTPSCCRSASTQSPGLPTLVTPISHSSSPAGGTPPATT